MKYILLATRNRGKIREIRRLISGISRTGIKTISLLDIDRPPRIIENGKTYLENALKKAKALRGFSADMVIADDSGLEVDFLKGAPGVKSSRFSGPRSSDYRNNKKLLGLLEGTKQKQRKARFVCTAVAYCPRTGKYKAAQGSVKGRIINEGRGSDGFGYDPLFYYTPLKKTFAQIRLSKKNTISHRYRAFKKLFLKLGRFLNPA